MSKSSNASVIIGAVVVVALALLAVRGMRVETSVGPSITVDPGTLEPDAGVIAAKLEMGGFSFLGLEFGRKTYSLDVQFVAPAGCASAVDFGDPWPAPFPACSSGLDISGEVTGRGILPSGESTIVVRTEVDAGCFEMVTPGDAWPTGTCD